MLHYITKLNITSWTDVGALLIQPSTFSSSFSNLTFSFWSVRFLVFKRTFSSLNLFSYYFTSSISSYSFSLSFLMFLGSFLFSVFPDGGCSIKLLKLPIQSTNNTPMDSSSWESHSSHPPHKWANLPTLIYNFSYSHPQLNTSLA